MKNRRLFQKAKQLTEPQLYVTGRMLHFGVKRQLSRPVVKTTLRKPSSLRL